MRGVAFIGGEAPAPELCRSFVKGAALVAAADSGLITAENAGVFPDWIVGDMDSLCCEQRLAAYPKERVLRYQRDKDSTDTELAVELLFKKGCKQVDLIGGGGGRLAHIAAIFALFDGETPPNRWLTSREEAVLIRFDFSAKLKLGTVVSVFPAGNGPWQAKSEGLNWSLDNVKWKRGVHGISNRAVSENVFIQACCGVFLIIIEQNL
ncbi:MAG: hypothetical protein Pg6A_00310 [Termitinemataceae bacterium]|nr:MAG: hypothetical protein Pg6A_00310 [Termitinemataceae bacterium]